MKSGRFRRYGEVHALRGGWWSLALFFERGRAICHTKGRHLRCRFDNGPEAVTCNWCRRKLGLVPFFKEPLRYQPPDTPPLGYEPETSRPGILFAELGTAPVIDVEAKEV